jgi:transcriptional regulator with AAA-type ATPase domain/transcriptional regulatory protein LevR
LKRIQRVEELLYRWTIDQFAQGCTAESLAVRLGIDRSNASRDLNALVAQGEGIKIGGKPVLFFSRRGLVECCGTDVRSWPSEFGSRAEFEARLKSLSSREGKAEAKVTLDAFDVLHGKHRSLKKPIELAKAAILYPPDGLHTLLTGPTGVGKTLFAECMYRFAVETGRLGAGAPFVAFNCADYANNPQLLLAQLFGVEKGAYTGADRERAGLVERADGGVLFLDEVHRLPPEGQEMLFTLLDRGMFRRLGESETLRRAKIRLIAATTENVQSSLLMTFVRRIPMWIAIPSLVERTLEERFSLIRFLFAQECGRVQRPLWIAPEVVKSLLLFDCPANVGQMKSEIQLLVARAFLAQMQEPEDRVMRVTLAAASDHVREGLLKAVEHKQELEEIFQELTNGLLVDGEMIVSEPKEQEDSVYDHLERQRRELSSRGLTESEIRHVLQGEIDFYFRKFLQRVSRQFESRRQDLAGLVGVELLEIVEEMFDLASRLLERVFPSQTVYGAALHMRAAAERIRKGVAVTEPSPQMNGGNREEHVAARRMAQLFTERTGLELPEHEVGFLATILRAAVDGSSYPKVGVLVLAHGTSTASSMLEVVQQLLGTTHGAAFDVPLHLEQDLVLERAAELVRENDNGKGVLVLADMGALTGLQETLIERTGSMIRTIPYVSTLTVVEAVRKAAFSDSTLEGVYVSVLQERATIVQEAYAELAGNKGTLLVVCVTGQGSAVQLKAILEETLMVPEGFTLEIVPVSITTFEETEGRLKKWLGPEKPLAIVGTLNPKLEGVPFISAQEVLSGEGQQRIAHLIGIARARGLEAAVRKEQREAQKEGIGSWERLMVALRGRLKRVNPYFVAPLVLEALERLAERGWPVDEDVRLGVLMHFMMALERRLKEGRWPTETRPPLPLPDALLAEADKRRDEVVAALAGVSAALELDIPDCEVEHLLRLLLQNGWMERGSVS